MMKWKIWSILELVLQKYLIAINRCLNLDKFNTVRKSCLKVMRRILYVIVCDLDSAVSQISSTSSRRTWRSWRRWSRLPSSTPASAIPSSTAAARARYDCATCDHKRSVTNMPNVRSALGLPNTPKRTVRSVLWSPIFGLNCVDHANVRFTVCWWSTLC